MLFVVLPLVVAMSGQVSPPQQSPPPQGAVQQAPAAAAQRPAAPRKIYNETADAKAQIGAAVAAAVEDDIRVLVNWGANDDANCVAFQGALYGGAGAPSDVAQTLRTKLSNEYKLVAVDVGHLDKNQDVARTYGARLQAGALPVLTLLDKHGKVIAEQAARQFASDADPATFDPKKILAFLQKHQVPPVDAQPLFAAALNKAKAENKEVFLWFSAPW